MLRVFLRVFFKTHVRFYDKKPHSQLISGIRPHLWKSMCSGAASLNLGNSDLKKTFHFELFIDPHSDMFSQTILGCGGWPVLRGVSSDVPELYPLDARSTFLLQGQQPKMPAHIPCQMTVPSRAICKEATEQCDHCGDQGSAWLIFLGFSRSAGPWGMGWDRKGEARGASVRSKKECGGPRAAGELRVG